MPFVPTDLESLMPCGVPAIDAARREAARSPTDSTNVARRQSLLFTWVRLMAHRGIELRDFETAAAEISKWGLLDASRYHRLDEAFRILNAIEAKPVMIPEIQGKPGGPAVTQHDWPEFQGSPSKGGYTEDAGPQTGEIAWRHPVGMSWYAAAAVADGRVYVASPGLTTLMMCFDESTGAKVWETAQNGLQVYSTPRASSSCEAHGDRILMRATSGSWEPEERINCIYYINRATGEVESQIAAERVDYRRGHAPVSQTGDYLVYAWSRLDLRGSPAVVQMQDTVVVKKSDGSPWWMMRVGEMFGAPVLAGDFVLAPVNAGRLVGLHRDGPQRLAWETDLGAPLRHTPTVVADTVLVGTEDGALHALELATGAIKWRRKVSPTEPRAFQLFSQIHVAHDRLWVGTAARELICLEVETGREVWRQATSDWIRSRPILIDDHVIAAGWDGRADSLVPRRGEAMDDPVGMPPDPGRPGG